MKKRYTIYLSRPLAQRFDAVSAQTGAKSALVEQALARQLDGQFDPDGVKAQDEARDTALVRRMDGLVDSLGTIERDVAIATETISLYVRYFLTITPPVPKAEQDAARALGAKRFEVFVGQLGRRLAADQRLVSEVLETIVANNPDLLGDKLDDGPSSPRPSAEIRPFRTVPRPAGNGHSTPLDQPEGDAHA